MEQRKSSRQLADMDVVIDYRGLGMIRGRALNISKGGMFVETGRIRLPMHAAVDAALIAVGSRPRALRFKAVVVQQGTEGVGLRISQMDEDAEVFLSQFAE